MGSKSLATGHEGAGKWVSLSLWLAGEEQGEACCAGWGLQTGGQSGGEVKIRFFWQCGVFGYDCSCWHVISLFVASQEGTGAKVNDPALWKHRHQALQQSEWTQRIVRERLEEDLHFCWDKNPLVSLWGNTENIQHLQTTEWVKLQLHHLGVGEARKSKLKCRWWTHIFSQGLKVQWSHWLHWVQLHHSSEFTIWLTDFSVH